MNQHEWDADGERCLKCGDKDWMGGPCRPVTTTATGVLDELRNLLCDSSTFEQGMDRIAALVEACKPFDFNVNTMLGDSHPMRIRHSAGEYRGLSAALKGIGNG